MKHADSERFVRTTMAAHALHIFSMQNARDFLGERFTLAVKAEIICEKSYFESKGILVSEDGYPFTEMFYRSFSKWLAMQKHDVRAVNSVYEYRQALHLRHMELSDEIYELENLTGLPKGLQKHVDVLLARKNEEDDYLTHWYFQMSRVADEIRKTAREVQEYPTAVSA